MHSDGRKFQTKPHFDMGDLRAKNVISGETYWAFLNWEMADWAKWYSGQSRRNDLAMLSDDIAGSKAPALD